MDIYQLNKYCCEIDLPEVPHLKIIYVMATSIENAQKAIEFQIKYELKRENTLIG